MTYSKNGITLSNLVRVLRKTLMRETNHVSLTGGEEEREGGRERERERERGTEREGGRDREGEGERERWRGTVTTLLIIDISSNVYVHKPNALKFQIFTSSTCMYMCTHMQLCKYHMYDT